MESRRIVPTLPVRVCSFHRSGTHFLMASLYANFNFPDLTTDLPDYGDEILFVNEGEYVKRCPWHLMFGSHDPWPNRDRVPLNKVLYIYRNPMDVMRSCCTLAGKKMEDESAEEVQAWMRRWYSHVESYFKAGAFAVSYEELLADFEAVMDRIGKAFKLERKTVQFVRPPLVGWVNRSKVPLDWQI